MTLEKVMDKSRQWKRDPKAKTAVEAQQFPARPASLREWWRDEVSGFTWIVTHALRRLPPALGMSAIGGVFVWGVFRFLWVYVELIEPGSFEGAQLRRYGWALSPEAMAWIAAVLFFLVAMVADPLPDKPRPGEKKQSRPAHRRSHRRRGGAETRRRLRTS
jgi:hypothetical protein